MPCWAQKGKCLPVDSSGRNQKILLLVSGHNRETTVVQCSFEQSVPDKANIVLVVKPRKLYFMVPDWDVKKHKRAPFPADVRPLVLTWPRDAIRLSQYRALDPEGRRGRCSPIISQPAASISVCLPQPSVTLESPVMSTLCRCFPTASFNCLALLLAPLTLPCTSRLFPQRLYGPTARER